MPTVAAYLEAKQGAIGLRRRWPVLIILERRWPVLIVLERRRSIPCGRVQPRRNVNVRFDARTIRQK
eukprot:COSAG01_NODE_153_length_23909_cov_32.542018_33_plen_67_part_00